MYFDLAKHVNVLLRVLCALIFLCMDLALAADRMSELREQAKHRQRRIIYNSDGDDIVLSKLTSVEEFLRQRTEAAIGTQVDSIFYSTSGGAQYNHDTNTGERWDDTLDAIEDPGEIGTKMRDNMRFLRSKGTDSLRATITRAHEAGLEIFWSHRINDTHDSVLEWPWHLSRWKVEHPEYLMGTPEDAKTYPQSHPKYWWSTLDFEKPQVRDYMFGVTEDVCRRYDVDGVEIDYWRYPVFFRPNRDLMPATEEQLDILTEFQRSIRQMAEREGTQRGRPILVAARVPMSVIACRNVGIDIERWLREDLVDLLILGNGETWPNLPVDEFVKLGHKHNVPVYPCLKYSGYGHDDIETWRAAASNAWRTGVDGMYFFNHAPRFAASPQFKELGDPEKLAPLDKLFAATDLGTNWPYIQTGQWHLGLAFVLPSSLPTPLEAMGEETVVSMEIGDDIAGAAKRKILESAVMKVRLSDANLLDAVETRLNGKLLTPTATDTEGGWLTFNPEPAWYRVGDNRVVLRLTKALEDSSTPAQVLAVETHVKYGPPVIARDGKTE